MKRDEVILVRGGGDLATGTIHRLWSAGLKVLVLEAEQPAAIRRQVSVSEAVYQGEAVVEGMRATLVQTLDEAVVVWCRGDVPVMVDPKGALIPQVRPAVVVDAILAKKNLGTTRDMAPLTIALGPGFTAGEDVDFVVETKRGHRLGRIIREGIAVPNTGVPGVIGGYSAERVVRAAREGIFHELRAIGDVVESATSSPRSRPLTAPAPRLRPASGASCGACCGTGIPSRWASRWPTWTPAARSWKTASSSRTKPAASPEVCWSWWQNSCGNKQNRLSQKESLFCCLCIKCPSRDLQGTDGMPPA